MRGHVPMNEWACHFSCQALVVLTKCAVTRSFAWGRSQRPAARPSEVKRHSMPNMPTGAAPLRHATGTVRWFDSAKGYGFATCDAAGPDCLIHQSSISPADYRYIEEGTRIAFDVLEALGGPLTVNVRRL
jgi:CspA family cold shock protein